MPKDDEIQPDQDDIQPNDQPDNADDIEDNDDFDPKLDAKAYAKKWRDASAEAAKNRKELAQLKAEKAKSEKDKLTEQGKYKEMYEALQKDHSGLKGMIESKSRSLAFRSEAIKAGANPEMISLLEKAADISKIDLDEAYKPDMNQIAHEVQKLKESYKDLFKKEVRPPKGGPPKTPDTEEKTLASEAKSAKTQAELDAVLKKYGVQ